MEDITKLILKLIEKKPNSVTGMYGDNYFCANYFHNNFHINLTIHTDNTTNIASVLIEKDGGFHTVYTNLTNSDFFKITLKIIEWRDVLDKEAIEDLSEFVSSPNGSMDDLLND